jgi:hypothetical protein
VGFKAEKPGELREAISQALKAEGPAIVDCVVAPDELPNLPHLDLEKIANFRPPVPLNCRRLGIARMPTTGPKSMQRFSRHISS